MPNDLVSHHFDQAPEAFSKLLRNRYHAECSSTDGEALLLLVHRLIDRYTTRKKLLAEEIECDAVTLQLLEAFAHIAGAAIATHETLGKRRLTLHRAIDYVESVSKPIAVPELATAIGSSQHLLELAFREALGISPVRYLRLQRMNQAYKELSTANPERSGVTRVAMDLGFYDLGRFAMDYKWLFNESPSTTLKRKASTPAKRLINALRQRADLPLLRTR